MVVAVPMNPSTVLAFLALLALGCSDDSVTYRVEGATPEQAAVIDAAATTWCDRGHCAEITDAGIVPIRVVQGDRVQCAASTSAIGCCKWRDGSPALIQILDRGDLDEMLFVTMHELGHALGCHRHTTVGVMSGSGEPEITADDLACVDDGY